MSDDEDDPFLMPLSQAVNHSDYALGAAAMQATEALGTQAGAPATNKRSGKVRCRTGTLPRRCSAAAYSDVERGRGVDARGCLMLTLCLTSRKSTHSPLKQIFNDPVHGHIYLPGMACQVIGVLSLLLTRFYEGREPGQPSLCNLGLVFLESILTMISLPSRFADTPEFQRLRDLKQLGTTYMVRGVKPLQEHTHGETRRGEP